MRDRDHGDVLLDQVIGFGIQVVALGLIGQRCGLLQRRGQIVELVTELQAAALAKVIVDEVGHIRIVLTPTQQVQ